MKVLLLVLCYFLIACNSGVDFESEYKYYTIVKKTPSPELNGVNSGFDSGIWNVIFESDSIAVSSSPEMPHTIELGLFDIIASFDETYTMGIYVTIPDSLGVLVYEDIYELFGEYPKNLYIMPLNGVPPGY